VTKLLEKLKIYTSASCKGSLWLGAVFFIGTLYANPVLNNVAAGHVSIQQAPNSTTIHQTSQKAIINWQSFNINANQSTHFQQPAGGIALNRINPTNGVSQIYGRLSATGEIILINPAGVFFGPSAYVNVGGLIATTANMSNNNFLHNHFIFDQASSYPGASIINAGTLIAAQKGLIALVGDNVTNNGLIKADLGQIALASGSAFTISFAGNSMVNFAFTSHHSHSGSVTNNGALIANGGEILVTAQQTANVLDNVINLHGKVEAKSVYQDNGDIVISGDPHGGVVNITADINASGKGVGQQGGTVNITGYDILLNSGTHIDASGAAGGGTVNVGGNEHGQGVLPNANALVMEPGASINASAITKGNGGNVVLWSDNYTQAEGSILATGGSQGGNGGFVETSSHNILDAIGASVNTRAPNGTVGTWLLDPATVTISIGNDLNYTNTNNVFTPTANPVTVNTTTLDNDLASNNIIITTNGVSGGTGNITVANSIAWSSAFSLTLSAYDNITINAGATITNTGTGGLTLQANNSGAFDLGTGGVVTVPNNTTINVGGPVNIYYNPSSYTSPTTYVNAGAGAVTAFMLINNATDLGVIDTTPATWSSVLALSTNIDASSLSFSPISPFGGIFNGQGHSISNISINLPSNGNVGFFGIANASLIENLGLINATINGSFHVGVLVGFENGATITNTYASGTVNAPVNGEAGGLIGFLQSGNVSDSYASVAVVGHGFSGGFVGIESGGNISNSYSTGAVTGNGNGGFVGLFNAGSMSNNYSTGALIGTNNGGFSGTASSIACTACFWDTQTSGLGTSTTGTGETTANMMTQSTFTGAGWDFVSTWNSVSGSYPYLQAFYPSSGASPTPITVSSSANAAAANLVVNGSVIDTAYAGSNGFIYFLEGNNALTGINNSIPTTTNFLVYLNSGSTLGNVVASMPANGFGGSSPLLSITTNAVTVGASSGASTFSNSTLATIINGLSSSNILYSVDSSNNLTLTGSDALIITSPTTYTFNGGVSGGSISNSGGLVFNNSTNTTVSTAISGAGSLTQAGSGTLILAANNTYGNTLISGGILQIGNGGATGSLGTGIVTNNSQLVFDLSSTLTVSNNIGGSGSLAQNGSGTLTLSGTNNYSGATSINAGTLKAGVVNAIPSGSTLILANVAGATFNLNNVADTIASLSGGGSTGGNVILGSGSLTVGGDNSSTTYGGAISGNGSFTKNGTGTLTLSGANNISGVTAINAGTLQVGNGGTTGSLGSGGVTNNSQLTFDLSSAATFSNSIGGSGAVTQNGTGTLTLSGANNFSGGININLGSLIASNAQALGSTTGSTSVNNGTSLTINGVSIANESISLNNATLNGSGAASLTGPITLGSNTSDVINSISGNFTISGAINGASAANASLTLQGAGTLTLANNIGSGTPLSTVTANTALTLTNNISITANTISINNGVNGAFNLTLNAAAFNLAGTLSVADLIIVGSGNSNSLSYSSFADPITITLTGGLDPTNLYSGVTTDDNSNSTITNYSNITSLIGNPNLNNSLILSAAQLATVQLNKNSSTSGTVGDPLSFTNFSVIGFVPPTPPVPPSPTPFIDVSSVIQQPPSNANNNNILLSDSSITLDVGSNITDLTQQIESLYDVQLSKVKINPFCGQTNY